MQMWKRLSGRQTWAVAGTLFALILIGFYFLMPYSFGYGNRLLSLWTTASHLWFEGEDWQHCVLVPFICLALIYYRRKDLAEVTIRPALSGWWILGPAFLLYWIGFQADQQYLGYASLQVFLAGVIVVWFGWEMMRRLFFPWAFFIFTWPLAFMDSVITVPLRMVMTLLASTLLNWMGQTNVQYGTSIQSAPVPSAGLELGALFSVDIADPCSGIRSLFALLMISVLAAHLFLKTWWQQGILIALAPVIAILGNLVRIMFLVIGTRLFGAEFAIGSLEEPSFFHNFAGFLVYAVDFALVLVVTWFFTEVWNKKPDSGGVRS